MKAEMTREEWLDRYKRRLMEVTTAEHAEAEAQADTFEVLSDGYEIDPEGAADEAMSYWEE